MSCRYGLRKQGDCCHLLATLCLYCVLVWRSSCATICSQARIVCRCECHVPLLGICAIVPRLCKHVPGVLELGGGVCSFNSSSYADSAVYHLGISHSTGQLAAMRCPFPPLWRHQIAWLQLGCRSTGTLTLTLIMHAGLGTAFNMQLSVLYQTLHDQAFIHMLSERVTRRLVTHLCSWCSRRPRTCSSDLDGSGA
jgi:hypothetical protein